MTVFERNDRVGGLLQYGIPSMKLGKDVLDRRVRLLAAEGVAFQCNVDVGKDISALDLSNEYVLKTFNYTTPTPLRVSEITFF